MDRLTMQNYDYADCEFMDSGIAPIFNRLAAYEDTGLDPEEVKSLKETWDLFGGADGVQRVYVERDEYKQAESEGRLIVLPCKVGDVCKHEVGEKYINPIGEVCVHCEIYGEQRNISLGECLGNCEAEAALGGDTE